MHRIFIIIVKYIGEHENGTFLCAWKVFQTFSNRAQVFYELGFKTSLFCKLSE